MRSLQSTRNTQEWIVLETSSLPREYPSPPGLPLGNIRELLPVNVKYLVSTQRGTDDACFHYDSFYVLVFSFSFKLHLVSSSRCGLPRPLFHYSVARGLSLAPHSQSLGRTLLLSQLLSVGSNGRA